MNELDEIVWVGDAAVEELDCGSGVVAVLCSNGNFNYGLGIENEASKESYHIYYHFYLGITNGWG